MALDNYSDISVSGNDVSAGFQFEFYCANCRRKWKSPFKPYRMGQITGLLTRFAYFFGDMRTASKASGNFSDVGSRGAKDKARAEALERARTLYSECSSCHQAYCAECFNTREDLCVPCIDKVNIGEAEKERAKEASGPHACPNCGSGHDGGRFCGECGFDMASTHKSCPGCGTMVQRQARFCTDCGHGF